MCQEVPPTARILIYQLTLGYDTIQHMIQYITECENKYNKHNSNPVVFVFLTNVLLVTAQSN